MHNHWMRSQKLSFWLAERKQDGVHYWWSVVDWRGTAEHLSQVQTVSVRTSPVYQQYHQVTRYIYNINSLQAEVVLFYNVIKTVTCILN